MMRGSELSERRKTMNEVDEIDSLEIEPLSDEALELVAGGKSTGGPKCCSCKQCCNPPPTL
jgi:hypothetical protein